MTFHHVPKGQTGRVSIANQWRAHNGENGGCEKEIETAIFWDDKTAVDGGCLGVLQASFELTSRFTRKDDMA